MASYEIDMIEGNGGTVDYDGFTGQRVATVWGLTSANGYDKIYEAIATVGIAVGDVHPSYIYSACQSVSAASMASDLIRLTYNYVPVINVPPKFNVGASTADQETNKDKSDNNIEVSYTYPSDYKGDPTKADQTETVGKIIAVKQPVNTIVIRKREIITGSQLTDRATAYVGKLNEAGWNLRPSDAARRWLCTGISGEFLTLYNNGGDLLDVYDTAYAWADNGAEGWDVSIVFLDPTTGDPPPPITWTANVTQKKVEVNQAINFNPLTSDVI